jgi:hypothetical protein
MLAGTASTSLLILRTRSHSSIKALDLVDLDWSPELWVAMHDEDDQNAALALRLWEDNDLEVPEDFFGDLVDHLGQSGTRDVVSS